MDRPIKISESPLPPVGEAESGQKLIHFLTRRLGLQWTLLQRWIRTGQIRINGKRSKPFDVVVSGDQIRLPPFAVHMAQVGTVPKPPTEASHFPPLIGTDHGLWAFDKPAGLAVQPGTHSADSVASRLAQLYPDYAFKPVPTHRLDKETSGVLLVAASFAALQKIHGWMRAGEVRKEYLAVICGTWPHADLRLIRHYLAIGDQVTAFSENAPGRKEAHCWVKPVVFGDGWTTVWIILGTGRKRQLRAQLSALGHPVLGDKKYNQAATDAMKLHSMRITLPNGHEFMSLPDWANKYGVTAGMSLECQLLPARA